MTTVTCGFCNNNRFLSDGPGTIELRDSRSRHVLAVGFHALLCQQCDKFVPAIANHKLTASDFHDEIREIISLLKGKEFPWTKSNPDFNECMFFYKKLVEDYFAQIEAGLVTVTISPAEIYANRDLLLSVETPKKHFSEGLIGADTKKNLELATRFIRNHFNGSLKLNAEPASGARLFLLVGPPGVGKTRFVQAVTANLGRSNLKISGGDIMSQFQGESTRKIRQFFSILKTQFRDDNRPFLYLNEFDSLSHEGSANVSVNQDALSMSAELNRLIDEYQGIVFLDTNHPSRLRSSHISRAVQISFLLPQKPCRKEFIEHNWPKKGPEITGTLRARIVNETNGASYRDLEKLLLVMLSESVDAKIVSNKAFEIAKSMISTPVKLKSDRPLMVSSFDKAMKHVTSNFRLHAEKFGQLEKRLTEATKQKR